MNISDITTHSEPLRRAAEAVAAVHRDTGLLYSEILSVVQELAEEIESARKSTDGS